MLELAAVTLASFAAGFVNSIAGGGGLVSLPVLFGLFPSADPATLFGTNKACMVWGTAWASAAYARHVTIPWRSLVPAVGAAICGGFAGAWLVTLVSAEWLRRLLPLMLAAVLMFTLFRRDLGRHHAPKHSAGTETLLSVAIALALGFYDGFFGPGTGSFFIFLYVHLLGFDFLHAVACAKILNTTTNLAALALFAVTGHVWWQYMIPMALANVAGSQLGTRLTLRHGSAFIRIVFIAVVGALILKTGYDAYGR